MKSLNICNKIVSDPALLTNIYYILGEECEEWPSPEMHGIIIIKILQTTQLLQYQ